MARSKQEERKPLLQGVTVVHDGAASGKHTATWMPVDTPGLGDRYPSQQSGCLGNVFFSWVTPLMKLGNERPLESDDLFQLDPHNRAANVSKKFADAWEQQTRSGKPSLEWALSKAFGFKFIVAGFLKLIHDSLQFVGPMVIKDIIAYLSDPTAPLSEGLTYAAVIFAAGVVQSFALRQYFFYCYEQKSLLLSAAARQQRTSGEITNLMSIDAQRLQDMTPYLHAVWYAAFQIIGVATFAGVAVILLVIPLMTLISKVMRKLQQRLMQVKDERIKICVEVLSGIKELARLRTYVFARSGSNTIFSFVPSLVTVVSFSAYVLLGHTLDVGTALTSLALFNILRFPLFMLPQVLNNVVEASVSFDRLRSYFLAKERTKVGEGDLTEVGISVRGADFKWDAAPPADKEKINEKKEEEEEALKTPVAEGPTLRHVEFSAKNGELHAIVGHVGSGKSTLLAGILGDARCSAGSVAIRGKVAYVSQQPFIQNATVRDNITFGLPFDADKYEEALRVSSLQKDLRILTAGDRTEIGEKGINLSGGQRTRVAIARAVYQDADIYLLDDILSAVDSHVGADIFNECIKKTLKDKLVVLVTHSLSFVSQCDQIAVITDGRIAEHGSYKKLMATKNLLAQMVSNYEELAITGRRKSSESRMHRRSRVSTRSDDSQAGVDDEGQLMVEEDRSVGDVSWSVYRVWINAFGGMCAAFLVVFGFFAAQGSLWWLLYEFHTGPASSEVPGLSTVLRSQRYFVKTSRELQRLDSISRSPIFALLSETLDGLSTIRAFGVQKRFVEHNNYRLDMNQRALNWTVRMASQLQTQMVSVERIQTYTEMPTEAGLVSTAVEKPPLDWPMAGAISFNRVDLRYRPGLPRVLRGLTFSVNAKEKVGIVGRTGAGKSSLIVGLMRLVELDAGSITIDGVDISKIGLHDLRSNIAITPQDPVLFSGTVRSNLDPFDQFSDDQIWTSVKRASLQKAITSLDDVVDEKGSNFSVGECQLLSIARALLKRSKVILMDEATASIDPETDRQIQQSIREEFRDCTTLTIAHRINTILDSDRILVMEKGSVAEFGSPAELQRKPNGIFKSLVDAWRQNIENKDIR
ncbi:hypothetical protein PInf_024142 [Phytophthora infestans]|nr:hypothetical protein PInf_024142 [Phytophthora infestans]